MVQTCSRCSRANPPDAAYCYHDGVALAGPASGTGPVAGGARPLPTDFVFPSGRRCRNFDELAVACQAEWPAAVEMLQKGYLESFLGSIGRADLAQAARQAAKYPDPARGLDQLLGALPTDVLAPARLQVEPREVNLGVLTVGENRQVEVRLANRGARLVYGSVTSDAAWLALGHGASAGQKLFEFTQELSLPLRVRGKYLRASSKPLEARLLIESNGGSVTVAVRADVPAKPFPAGALAGARSPRQLAEMAKTAAKEAAPLFEQGAVADWYRDNGWTYPVQGPAAAGLGAVQQFFEALGLTPPPKVELSETAILLRANAGDSVHHGLEVRTQEKRLVYAYADSDQPWLQVGRPQLNGRTATVPLTVPVVPAREGETLTAHLTVTANGNQRFVVPVSLEVGSSLDFGDLLQATPAPADEPPRAAEPAPTELPAAGLGLPPPAPAKPVRRPARRSWRELPWKHAVPAALLVLVLLAGMVWDGWSGAGPGPEDARPLLGVKISPKNLRFGIVLLNDRGPTATGQHARLTGDELGQTNNTCVRLDDQENLLGQRPGRPVGKIEVFQNRRWTVAWEYPEKVRVTQLVEVVRGEQSRLRDTCLVRYVVHNLDRAAHKVGLRVLLDTFVGGSDGVPFAVPGRPGLLETVQRFEKTDVPDFLQMVERPDLADPGTVAQMGFRPRLPGADEALLEPIDSVLVCRRPGNSEVRWEWKPEPMNEPAADRDSCVALYWSERELAPQEKREMAFTYGLGTLSGAGGGALALTAGGPTHPGGTFTVMAYVRNPEPGQTATLRLPAGLSLAAGQEAEQTVKAEGARDLSQVSWRVHSVTAGDHVVEVESAGVRERLKVRVRDTSVFD